MYECITSCFTFVLKKTWTFLQGNFKLDKIPWSCTPEWVGYPFQCVIACGIGHKIKVYEVLVWFKHFILISKQVKHLYKYGVQFSLLLICRSVWQTSLSYSLCLPSSDWMKIVSWVASAAGYMHGVCVIFSQGRWDYLLVSGTCPIPGKVMASWSWYRHQTILCSFTYFSFHWCSLFTRQITGRGVNKNLLLPAGVWLVSCCTSMQALQHNCFRRRTMVSYIYLFFFRNRTLPLFKAYWVRMCVSVDLWKSVCSTKLYKILLDVKKGCVQLG